MMIRDEEEIDRKGGQQERRIRHTGVIGHQHEAAAHSKVCCASEAHVAARKPDHESGARSNQPGSTPMRADAAQCDP